jgi:hypothetical protein
MHYDDSENDLNDQDLEEFYLRKILKYRYKFFIQKYQWDEILEDMMLLLKFKLRRPKP